jgi:ATP-dependent DNA ligase
VVVMLRPVLSPILARPVDTLPGPGALPGGTVFEPKWDGYRVLVFADADGTVFLQSRNGRDLTRAFPEIAGAAAVLEEDLVLDGEAVIYTEDEGGLSFHALQHRLGRSPRATARLAAEQPAHLIVFDLLQRGATELIAEPYHRRRAQLQELFAERALSSPWSLTPSSTDPAQAEEWLSEWTAVGVEGIVAKGAAQPYVPGRRGWLKYRSRRTTEAVVGAVTGTLARPRSLLLGRFDLAGRLRYTGRTTSLNAVLAREVADLLGPPESDEPAHPWEGIRFTAAWGSREPLQTTLTEPALVMEISADISLDAAGRWRHPVRAVRPRPDMAPGDVPFFGEGNQPAAG